MQTYEIEFQTVKSNLFSCGGCVAVVTVPAGSPEEAENTFRGANPNAQILSITVSSQMDGLAMDGMPCPSAPKTGTAEVPAMDDCEGIAR